MKRPGTSANSHALTASKGQSRASRVMVRLAFEKYSSATNRGLRRVGDVYAEFLEVDFHAAIEFPLHRPTARIGAFDLTDDRHHRPVDLIDSPKIEVAAHQRFKLQLTRISAAICLSTSPALSISSS